MTRVTEATVGAMSRFERRDALAGLDPETDYQRIYRDVAAYEFPWDLNQSLNFALFRTFAVPTIGELLATTGEFTERVQKRYDDTALILDAVLEHGFASAQGRDAVRRMNHMHGSYPIGGDDMRYVLATFVVVPARWMAAHAWRPFSPVELRASVNYYRRLGELMGIRDIPGTYAEFDAFLDGYEQRAFGFSAGGRAVADSTLTLMATFPVNRWAPAEVIRRFSYALMDDRLLDALRYPRPSAAVRRLSTAALRLRGRVVRRMPVRRAPTFARQLPQIRSYPDGYTVAGLGTFPARGCPAAVPEAGP